MKSIIMRWYNDANFTMWYQNNALIANCVVRGMITAADYEEITGETYNS